MDSLLKRKKSSERPNSLDSRMRSIRNEIPAVTTKQDSIEDVRASNEFTPKIRGGKRRKPPKVKEKKVKPGKNHANQELNSLDFDDDFNVNPMEQGERHSKMQKKVLSLVLSFLCVYMVYLVYGVVMTDFVFSDKGLPVPEVKNVEEIKEQHDFSNMASYYYRAREIYEQVLTLDYRMAEGQEDPLTIAPEYDAMLETIGKLSIDLQALSPRTEYSQIRSLLLTWVGTDVAVYCQNMSTAISQNNNEKAEQAILGREVCFNDFATLTANIVSMGCGVKGIDISEISEWSTEQFIADELEGGKFNEE